MFAVLRRAWARGWLILSTLGMAACGQFPEPATEQPLLSAWVAERYAAELLAAEIVKINSYSDQFEKPIYVEMRDNVPIYFPWEPVGLISPMRCDQKSA